jgi:GNAT superfamily N-acetyltransferase
MEQASLIYSKSPVSITVSPVASSSVVALLQRTTYGTNGPKYSHTGQGKKVAHITGPHFFELRVGEQVVGAYCLSERLLQTPAGNVTGFYGRYLTIDPAHSGKGYGSLLKTEAVRYIERTAPGPHVFYSYIEEANERSMRISAKEGFTSLAQLEALVFGRLYPKKDGRFARLPSNELGLMLTLLKAAYQPYSCVQFDHMYDDQNYFVLRENGELIAGVQANPVLWRIVEMPGLSGKLMLNVLPHLPILKRIINPNRYAFAALEAVYLKPGREQELFALLESVLAHLQVTSALLMLDVHAPLSHQLKSSGKLGILNSLKKNIYTEVMVKLNGLMPQQLKQMPNQPLYTSAFDYT